MARCFRQGGWPVPQLQRPSCDAQLGDVVRLGPDVLLPSVAVGLPLCVPCGQVGTWSWGNEAFCGLAP